MRVMNELEKILDEHSSDREAAKEYLESRQDEKSRDILRINMLEHFRNQQEGRRNAACFTTNRTGGKRCIPK